MEVNCFVKQEIATDIEAVRSLFESTIYRAAIIEALALLLLNSDCIYNKLAANITLYLWAISILICSG
jgi:hypothetical protein